MTYLVATAIASLVIALALSRARHDARSLSWRALLAPEARAALEQLEERCRLEDAMLVHELAAAARIRVDRRAQAERMLRAVLQFVEEAQPERLERLHALRDLARMTAAAMVAPALAPRQFRLPELWATTSLGALAHLVLVSPAERLVLRLYVVTIGLQLSLRSMRRAAARPAWARFERSLADWCVLDQAHAEAVTDLAPSKSAAPAAAGR